MTVGVAVGRRGTGVPTTVIAVCRRVFTLVHLTVVNVKIAIFFIENYCEFEMSDINLRSYSKKCVSQQ